MVTDRWQKFTQQQVTLELMEKLGSFCDEFLVHAVDVGRKSKWNRGSPCESAWKI